MNIKIKNINIIINVFMLVIFILYFFYGYIVEVIIMFITVFIHELSHNAVAKLYGLEINEVELFPFGGVARHNNLRMMSPKEEMVICIIGPLCNLIIMLFFTLLKNLYLNSYIINYIIKVNKLMFLLNIAPVFPLDGGKVARSLLSLFIGYKSATNKLVYSTYFICTFIILYDILNGIIKLEITYLSIVAVFTIVAAKKEREMAAFVFISGIMRKKDELKKTKISKVHFLVCLTSVNIKEAIEYILPSRYHIFILINNNGETIGTITEIQLIDGIYRYGYDITLEKLL